MYIHADIIKIYHFYTNLFQQLGFFCYISYKCTPPNWKVLSPIWVLLSFFSNFLFSSFLHSKVFSYYNQEMVMSVGHTTSSVFISLPYGRKYTTLLRILNWKMTLKHLQIVNMRFPSIYQISLHFVLKNIETVPSISYHTSCFIHVMVWR